MLAALLYRIRAKIKAALPPNRNGEAARLTYQPIALGGLQSPESPCCAITPAPINLWVLVLSGGDLFSHSVTRAVSSALGRFTTVFGMGTGGATPLEPPESNGTIMPHIRRLGKSGSAEIYPCFQRSTGGKRTPYVIVKTGTMSRSHDLTHDPSAGANGALHAQLPPGYAGQSRLIRGGL